MMWKCGSRASSDVEDEVDGQRRRTLRRLGVPGCSAGNGDVDEGEEEEEEGWSSS